MLTRMQYMNILGSLGTTCFRNIRFCTMISFWTLVWLKSISSLCILYCATSWRKAMRTPILVQDFQLNSKPFATRDPVSRIFRGKDKYIWYMIRQSWPTHRSLFSWTLGFSYLSSMYKQGKDEKSHPINLPQGFERYMYFQYVWTKSYFHIRSLTLNRK